MGWTGHVTDHAMSAKEKREYLDNLWNAEKCRTLKSAMVGSTYYAAVKELESGEVFGFVVITHMLKRGENWYEFQYKELEETMGISECNCSKGILNLLTPTDNEYAIQWRYKCAENLLLEEKKRKVAKAPVGSRLCFNSPMKLNPGIEKGDYIELVKRRGRYKGQVKEMWTLGNYRFPNKYINYEEFKLEVAE